MTGKGRFDPDGLGRQVADALGTEARAAVLIGGGDINHALALDLTDGRRVFVKSRSGAAPGAFAAEARGLRWLADGLAGQTLRVPEVLAWHDPDPAHAAPAPDPPSAPDPASATDADPGPDPRPGPGRAMPDGEPGWLALAWVEPGRPGPTHDDDLGRGLAALHRSGATVFGLEEDTALGSLQLPNDPCATWAEFYGQRRLLPLARRAVDDGVLPPSVLSDVDRLVGRLPDLVGPPEPPARLHGDLWGGNAITDADGHPLLIDPAVYGGHREVDLAMMRLFGGFGPRVFSAYQEVAPLAAGHEDRVPLYQLHPLLVHAVLFGGSYRDAVTDTLRRLG